MKNLLWPLFVVFVVAAIYSGWHPEIFTFTGPGILFFWIAFIVFTAYSVYCSTRENILSTIGTMLGLDWGRQIGLDLYIGLTITALIIYLHTGSAAIALIWLIPLYLFGNLATLLYFAINYDSLMTKFLT